MNIRTIIGAATLITLASLISSRAQGTIPLRITCPPDQTNCVCGVHGHENAHFQARGATAGMDIVEVLDGFICRGHATAEQIDQLINHAMMFGYPLDAPADCD